MQQQRATTPANAHKNPKTKLKSSLRSPIIHPPERAGKQGLVPGTEGAGVGYATHLIKHLPT
jgi:hypothetical protein